MSSKYLKKFRLKLLLPMAFQNFLLSLVLHTLLSTFPVFVSAVKMETFEFERPEPANSLGIFPKVIAYIERDARKVKETWRINKAFTTDEVFERLTQMCDREQDEPAHTGWSDCAFDDTGLMATVAHGTPEKKKKALTYLAVDFKPFTRIGKGGQEEVCALDEVYYQTVYFVLKTYSDLSGNKTFPRSPVEGVAAVHQHQLDVFGPTALSIFEETITNHEAIYNFGEKEYYTRHPPYECFLAIGSGQSEEVIEEKCSFFCLEEAGSVSGQEFRALLEHNRVEVMEDGDDEDEEDWVEHQEL